MKSDKRSRSRSPMAERRSSRSRSRSPKRTRIPTSKRVVISNIPYDLKWHEIKDIFRKEVGDDMYVELFNNPDGKPKGMGVVEFKDIDTAALAIEKMHRYEIKDRKLVVREERERERRQHEAMSSRGGGGGRGGHGGQGVMGPGPGMGMGGGGRNMNSGQGMGGPPPVSPQVLQQLGIDGPVTNTVFISNLEYNVGWKKLKDVFKLAGNVLRAEIKEDKDGKSRGMGTVTFETPGDAVQAISMFNNQSLFDRTMRVKMDGQSSAASRPEQLPSGLKGVGPTLNNLQMNTMDMGMGGSNMGMGGGMGMNDGMGRMGDGMRGMGMNSGMSGMAGGSMSGMGGGGMSGMGSMGSGIGGSGMNNSMGMGNMSGMGSMGSGMGMGDSFGGMSGMGSSNSSSIMGGGMSDNFGSMSSMGMGGGSSYSGMMDSSRSSGMGSFSSGMNSRSDYGRDRSDRGSSGMGMGGSNMGMGGASSMPSGDMRTRADKSTVIVKNLPYSMDWQTLKSKFVHIGDIRFAEISKDDRGKSQGWGLISFRREEDAKIAVQKMNRVNLDGRDVVVKMLN